MPDKEFVNWSDDYGHNSQKLSHSIKLSHHDPRIY